PIIAKLHAKGEQATIVENYQRLQEEHWPAVLKGYICLLIKPDTKEPDYKPTSDDLNVLAKIQSDPQKYEDSRLAPKENAYYFYGAIRAGKSCVECHASREKMAQMGAADKANPDLKPDDLMAVARIRLP